MSKKLRIALLRSGVESNMDSLALGFKNHGYEIQLFEMSPFIIASEMISDFKKFAADIYITHNYYFFNGWGEIGQEIESWLHESSKPIVAWYWDSPLVSGNMNTIYRYIFGPFPKNVFHLVIDREWIPFLKERGISCEYLPIAADERFANFKSKTSWAKDIDISFVGKPFTDISEPVSGSDDIHLFFREQFLAELFDILESKKSAFGLDKTDLDEAFLLINEEIEAFFIRDLITSCAYESAKNNLQRNLKGKIPPSIYKIVLLMLGRLDMLYSWGQLSIYLQDLETIGIRVFGGEEWNKYFLKQNKFSTHRLSDLELLECFAQSKISFCHTKWQFLHGVHERPFMVAALGGFALTDERAGLWEAFEKNEIVTFENIDDAKEKSIYYLRNETERNKISSRARSRVLKDHTYSVRALQIIELTKNWANL